MGCWGYGILESDDALDWEGEIFKFAHFDIFNQDPTSPKARQALEQNLASIFGLLDAPTRWQDPADDAYQRAVGYQVLSSALMAAGCTLTEAQRQTLIAHSTDCHEYRMATHTPAQAREKLTKLGYPEVDIKEVLVAIEGERCKGRRQAIDALVNLLEAYDIAGGTPRRVASRGLLETISTARG